MSQGSRNLFLLGFGAITIALVTCSISLFIYHHSGDIYLDRSRPGFLPEPSEVQKSQTSDALNYSFPESDTLTRESLQKYLDAYKERLQYTDRLKNPFDPSPLSDESLGITE